MSSGFLGLTTSLSGLFANQRSLGIVSHNIANANTEGYSRQVMNTKAYKPQMLPGGMGALGVGVDVTAVKQIRDAYLDSKFRDETSAQGEWTARADVLQEVEGIFNEPSDSSVAELLDQYYESLQSLQKNPENLTARTLVRQTTIALTEGVGRISTMLKELQKDLNMQFEAAVGEVNDIADQIATLNETIFKAELEGGKANDLRDQRELLLDKLSEFVNINYYEDSQNRFYVSIGGQEIVSHFRADELETVERTSKINEDDSEGIWDVQWSNGNTLNAATGKIKGLRDVRDNNTELSKGIPYYIDKLNEFVDVLHDTMNGIHETGFGLDGSIGNYMFTMDGMSTAEYKAYLTASGTDVTATITAGGTLDPTNPADKAAIDANIEAYFIANPDEAGKRIKLVDDQYLLVEKVKADRLSLASDLDDLNKIAAATNLADIPGDGGNILKMIETRHDTKLYDWGAPEDFVKSLVSNLGVDAAEANRVKNNQDLLTNEYSMSRDSVMGVSLDEEMANMIKFQTAYNANARMINVFDEMLDLVVNRLGTVGR
ncbi:flagellar hook-associated protein FlgK [Fusibacter tunisiensis]|uniref:Flagellar hook-associated protein 1 n=1 Tax=Fusibacter tunisiensis TaxID=1008308 RepID=A0ABS2MPJ8_9FIRM|nr:flagellar hook-associated protein FlgK [Fusibacter tunisiensis]MBM7561320.1 flagellar hook-associated protein 1 FlgK [Fusibacter tunisiensis]